MAGWHGILQQGLDTFATDEDRTTQTLFLHGSLKVMLYSPKGNDPQKPHDRDEFYVIARGSGTFRLGDNAFDFNTGDSIFVPSGVEHRFEKFSDDLVTWVMFYGPTGGEVDEKEQ
ncbi:MAG: cupin domain-containing protein [Methyloligellaceae bacterium]